MDFDVSLGYEIRTFYISGASFGNRSSMQGPHSGIVCARYRAHGVYEATATETGYQITYTSGGRSTAHPPLLWPDWAQSHLLRHFPQALHEFLETCARKDLGNVVHCFIDVSQQDLALRPACRI